MAQDVLPHLRLGRGGQAQHRRIGGLFADEARHIAVIRPKVMAPLGQAMRLVEHPSADLPLR